MFSPYCLGAISNMLVHCFRNFIKCYDYMRIFYNSLKYHTYHSLFEIGGPMA